MQQDIINIDLKLPTKCEDLDNSLTLGKKKTRFSFCSRSIANLTSKQPQLRYLYELMALGLTATQIKSYCLFQWSGMQVMCRYGKGWWCKFAKDEFVIFAEQINAAIASLDWLDTPPAMPIRLSRIGRHRAVAADFEGVPFETFIVCDNLYQGYLATKQEKLLDEMASHLYSSKFRVYSLEFIDCLGRLFPPYTLPLTQTERISVFYWFASLKGFLARVFKHFFQPIGNASGADGRFFEVSLSQAFLEYGLWQDYGTGRETPRGNSGDIGRANRGSSESRGELARAMSSRDRGRRSQRRQRRKWFSRKYYALVMRIKEFYEDNIGKTFTGILSNALNKNFGRNH